MCCLPGQLRQQSPCCPLQCDILPRYDSPSVRLLFQALCYNSEDVSVWLHVVDGAVKMKRARLFRFALDSALAESLKDGANALELIDHETLPILPPARYKAIKYFSQIIPVLHDTFAYDAQLSTKVANAIGINSTPMLELKAKPLELGDCDQIRVEADSWYSLGKCLLNAPAKLCYPSIHIS
jgi:hypothetical protein